MPLVRACLPVVLLLCSCVVPVAPDEPEPDCPAIVATDAGTDAACHCPPPDAGVADALCTSTAAYVRMGLLDDLRAATGVGDEFDVAPTDRVRVYLGYGVEGLQLAAAADVFTYLGYDGRLASTEPEPARIELHVGGFWNRRGGPDDERGFETARGLFEAMTEVPETRENAGRVRRSPRGIVTCSHHESEHGVTYRCVFLSLHTLNTIPGPCGALPPSGG